MLEAGQTINSRYLLQSPIGEGAMGAVWKAEDQTLRRQVAIKFLFGRGTRDPQAMVDQFLREARIAASVQHRNVIQTVDFGTVDQYQPFMVMELLNGESLGDRMDREPKLTTEQLIHIMSLTLRGLSAVHDAGIVHRDLKPQNVFLQRDEGTLFPKILDFGISRSVDGGPDRSSAIATQEGLIVGTPDYMSPEQARGEGNIDKRSDIYSIGVILYEGLTGRLPFDATAVGDLIVQIVTKEPPRMKEIEPSISQALSDMVAQAMSKNREHRFADARAMRRALLAAAEAGMAPARRAVASMPPPASAIDPLAALGLPQPPSPGSATQAATWGALEGLNAQRVVDNSAPLPPAAPGPSVPPPSASPQQQRLVARVGDQLAGPAALAAQPLPGPSAGSSAKRNMPTPASTDLDVALNPLYAGNDQAIPELDYERGRPPPGARRSAGTPAQPLRRASNARMRAPQPKIRTRINITGWILPVLAVAAVWYTVMSKQPRGSVGRSAAAVRHTESSDASGGSGPMISPTISGSDVSQMRAPTRGRRGNPGSTVAHMRDVVF